MTPPDRAAAMVTPHAAMDPLERALSYPYAAPAHSYLFRGGEAVPAAIGASDRAGRIPVLACGSNRAPAQLKRKFAGMAGAVIAAERVFLADFDSVYAAHISGYGAIAATLQHSPGTRVELFITWLPEALMGRMHATEGRGAFYDYVRLDGLALESEGGDRFGHAYAYAFRGGCLLAGDIHHDGAQVHSDHLLNKRDHNDQPRSLDSLKTAQKEDHTALVFAQYLDGGKHQSNE
jgi:hypothetical protein